MTEETKEIVNIQGRFIRYIIVGGAGTILYMGIVILLVEYLNVDPTISVMYSMVVLLVYTYIMHRKWVYESRSAHKESIPKFMFAAVIGLLLNYSIMFITVDIIGFWYIWGLFSTIVIVPPTNFIINYLWTFK